MKTNILLLISLIVLIVGSILSIHYASGLIILITFLICSITLSKATKQTTKK